MKSLKKISILFLITLFTVFTLAGCGGGGDDSKTTPVAVTRVSLDNENVELYISATKQLTATITPANAANKAVTYSSSDDSIATVNSTGLVTANASKNGSSTITVTTADGAKTATCNVTVTTVAVPMTAITITPATVNISVGATRTLTYTYTPDDANTTSVMWHSVTTSVATVDSTGVVTGVAAGTAVITATSVYNTLIKAICNVTVTDPSTDSGTLTVTATYSGSGTVDASHKIYVIYSTDYFVEEANSGTLGSTSSNGGPVTKTLPVGTYQIVVLYDIDGNGMDEGDSAEFYENITEYAPENCKDISITDGENEVVSISFDDTFSY